jgi:hypothetical protein
MSPENRNQAQRVPRNPSTANNQTEPLLRLRQLAEAINVPARSLARWTADKRIPSLKIGASRFYRASRVLEALNRYEEGPAK